MLLSLLKRGDELLYITGQPYDTPEKVIGNTEEDIGSLREMGVTFNTVDLKNNQFDTEGIFSAINDKTKIIGIQRSRGYSSRKSMNVKEIEEIIKTIKEKHPHIIIFVDNCYSEFAETREPLEAGADIMAGSLIKNRAAVLRKWAATLQVKKNLSNVSATA